MEYRKLGTRIPSQFLVVQTKSPTQAAKTKPLEWGTLVKILRQMEG